MTDILWTFTLKPCGTSTVTTPAGATTADAIEKAKARFSRITHLINKDSFRPLKTQAERSRYFMEMGIAAYD